MELAVNRMPEASTPAPAPDPYAKAREIGVVLIDYGIELSKGAGFTPPTGVDVEAQAQAILKDSIPRVLEALKADGLL